MRIRLHPHTLARMRERGATEQDVLSTIQSGERSPATHGRTTFRKRFRSITTRGVRIFGGKEILAYAVMEDEVWLVLTVIVTYLRPKERLQ